MEIALITGASSGLGREFVRQIAAQQKLDEIWVVARREERLLALAEEVDTPLRVLPLDLTLEESMKRLRRLLKREQPRIRVLVNAAGFGKLGGYQAVSRRAVDKMIVLNCRAAVDVTLLSLPYMGKGGRVLEICSTSAFQPLPELNVYAATKAFLLRYSRALRWELMGRGIKVTAVCPYWVRGTEFIPKTNTGSRVIRHFPLAGRPEPVVRQALRDSALGMAVSTPGPVSSVHRLLAKMIPEEIMIAGWELLRRI